MSADPSAAELRRRARGLRTLATHLDNTPVDDLLRWAGPDTWISARAEAIRTDLAAERHRLRAAADDLREHARWLDAQAEVAEAAAALAQGMPA